MKEYPIFGAPPAAGWELIIVKGQGYSSAAFVGFIRNSFGGQSIDAFLGEEHDVSLEPIVNDILGFRSRIAVSSFGTQVDEYRQQLMGLFPAEVSHISTVLVTCDRRGFERSVRSEVMEEMLIPSFGRRRRKQDLSYRQRHCSLMKRAPKTRTIHRTH